MPATSLLKTGLTAAAAAFLGMSPATGLGQASPYRGLWIGSASLNAVNEVAVPLNAQNVAIAPDPEVATPTFDQADLRLLIHVNGAGQARLLKDVAILNRVHDTQGTNVTAIFAGEEDLSLVTDPLLYAMFPPQPAIRYASAVFDFGDAKATEAVDAIVETAAQQAMVFTTNSTLDVSTGGARVQARNDAIALIEPQLDAIAVHANVTETFNQFLLQFDTAALSAIISNTAAPVVASLTATAELFRAQSFYNDTRASEMVTSVVAAVEAALPADRATAAHHAASAYADVENLYQRFISGSAVGEMIVAAAEAAGVAATLPGATAAGIETELRAQATSVAALTGALQARVQMYDDRRATDAVNAVLVAMAASAFANGALSSADIRVQSAQAGRLVLSDMVARYPLPVQTPTLGYTNFVQSVSFGAAPAAAAFAAAEAAIEKRGSDPLYTPGSLYEAARVAAINALQKAYGEAARVMRMELPMAGAFSLGGALEGRIYLPANYPTNPFRHRRHPDHSTGYNIERIVQLDFDGAQSNSLKSATYGVDRITGSYHEEIFGLHKPLGPAPETRPIGLRTEGRFELNRISFIDTLNTL